MLKKSRIMELTVVNKDNFEKVVELNSIDLEKEVVTTKNRYKAKTVILATGSESRRLGLENEQSLIGKGVSYYGGYTCV